MLEILPAPGLLARYPADAMTSHRLVNLSSIRPLLRSFSVGVLEL